MMGGAFPLLSYRSKGISPNLYQLQSEFLTRRQWTVVAGVV